MTHGDLIGACVPIVDGKYSSRNLRELLFEYVPDEPFYEWLNNAVKNKQAFGAYNDIYVSLDAVNELDEIAQAYISYEESNDT